MWTSLPFLSTQNHHYLSPFTHLSQTMSSTKQAHTRHESEEDKEFSFWGSSNTIASENDCDSKFKFEHSPFLPGSSDPSRSKAIAEGRRELMELMQDMSESSYELSLQDMVVEQQPQPDQNEKSVDNTLMQSSGNKALKKKKKKKSKSKSNKPDRIMRIESMESETFLLKMFFPSSLDWMKKAKVQQNVSNSKVSQRPSSKESIKQVDKEWRIKRFFLAGDNKGDTEDGLSQNKSRYIRIFPQKIFVRM